MRHRRRLFSEALNDQEFRAQLESELDRIRNLLPKQPKIIKTSTQHRHPYDRDGIHQILWNRTDERGILRTRLKDLAVELGIAPPELCNLFREFKGKGRMKQLNSGKRSMLVYLVKDPNLWEHGSS